MGSGNPAAGAAGAQPRRSRFVRPRTAAELAFDAFNYLLLGLFCLTVLYPFWTTLILSLSGPDSASSLGMRLWSEDFQFTAYRFAMSRYGKVTTAYGNSIARTGLGIALTVSPDGAGRLSVVQAQPAGPQLPHGDAADHNVLQRWVDPDLSADPQPRHVRHHLGAGAAECGAGLLRHHHAQLPHDHRRRLRGVGVHRWRELPADPVAHRPCRCPSR